MNFYKNTRKAFIYGVCSGLSESLNINPQYLRLIFLFLTLLYGFGLFFYIFLALFLSDKYTVHSNFKEKIEINWNTVKIQTKEFLKEIYNLMKKDLIKHYEKSPLKYFGSIIIIFGIFLFLSTFGIFSWLTFTRFIAILIILIGFWLFSIRA